jgi:hypothetical protein
MSKYMKVVKSKLRKKFGTVKRVQTGFVSKVNIAGIVVSITFIQVFPKWATCVMLAHKLKIPKKAHGSVMELIARLNSVIYTVTLFFDPDSGLLGAKLGLQLRNGELTDAEVVTMINEPGFALDQVLPLVPYLIKGTRTAAELVKTISANYASYALAHGLNPY